MQRRVNAMHKVEVESEGNGFEDREWVVFFFSSRRRHTRYWRDWSSDVCSSDLPGGSPNTVAGDTVHLVLGDRLVSYDASEDAWSVSPPAPVDEVVHDPAAVDDGTVVLVDAERDGDEPSGQVYDPRSRTWSELTGDPLGPTFDRAVTAIPGGLVLTAATLSGGENARPTLRAAVLDLTTRTWAVLHDDQRSGGGRWSWTGERLIGVSPDAQD